MSELKSLIEHITKALVDVPEAVEVREIKGEQTTVLELKVDKTDLGKVIGKQGKTIHTLRALLLAGSAKKGQRCSLEIVEDRPAT